MIDRSELYHLMRLEAERIANHRRPVSRSTNPLVALIDAVFVPSTNKRYWAICEEEIERLKQEVGYPSCKDVSNEFISRLEATTDYKVIRRET
jgi:hypothetical protein